MKKLFFILSFLLVISPLFSQNNNDDINRIIVSSVNNGTQIDIFFEESVNPKTLSSSTILINDTPINSNTKIIFNRDGTQVRFVIESQSSFTLQLTNVKTNSGKTINTSQILLNGDSTWKKY